MKQYAGDLARASKAQASSLALTSEIPEGGFFRLRQRNFLEAVEECNILFSPTRGCRMLHPGE